MARRACRGCRPGPDRLQLVADLAGVAAGLTWTELEYYWLAACVLA
jgi:hypothetical protein